MLSLDLFIWETHLIIKPDIIERSTLVGQRPIKSLVRLSVCLFVCPSVHLSLTFLKLGPLVFSDIVHDDNWPWYVKTDEARFLKKKNSGLNFGRRGQNCARN